MKSIALALFALTLPAVAAAGDFRFDYSPQQLATPDGVKALHAKLEMDVNRYCREQFITLNQRGTAECTRELLEKTVQQIGNARLAEYQQDRALRSS